MFLFTYITYYVHLHLNVFHKVQRCVVQSLSYPKYQYLIDCNINIQLHHIYCNVILIE